ncbi:BRCT domain-containing protein [Aspergillus similis]
MAGHQDDNLRLFDQLKVCIVCSKELSTDVAHQLASTLEAHGGEPVVYEPPAEFPDLAAFSHIMSTTIDFPQFDAAKDALIPVIKPQWMHASLAKRRLANVRQYSPDPRLFLNDVVVTCGDIPEGDKDAIIGGVLAKGGLYNPRLTGMCTHLVDLTIDSDKAKQVRARNLNVKIVLPHWFDDCLKLGRRIDERPYKLPDPEILRAAPDAPIRSTESRDIIGASTPEPSKLPTPLTSPVKPKLNVFHGKVIMLSSDLEIGSHLRDTISAIVEENGGKITTEISRATTFICRFRDGFNYRVASRLNKDVGNLSWLYHLMTYDSWTSPYRRLLHYPIPKTPIPGFEKFKISLSNYVGEARSYLEHLITATGAECTKTLRQENTHLVTAHDNSEKCSAAREWNIHVVNHLWLEECYAQWRLLPESNNRYTHFPRRTNLGEVVGQTRLDRSALESMFFASEEAPLEPSRKAMQKRDQNTAPEKPLSSTDIDENVVSDTTNATPAGKSKKKTNLHTPSHLHLAPDGKENDTPSSTSSRKSKEAATARLHEIAPDIALYEKERKRVGGVIYGGRRKTDEERVVLNSKKRSSMEAQTDSEGEDTAEAKRQKKSKPPITMHLLITGYQRWVGNMKKEDAEKRQLRELGIMVVQDARKCSHLAAPSVLRTPKFVNAIAYSPVIVQVEFITQCLKKNKLLDPEDFLLDDKEAKKFGFSLEQAKVNARANKNKLLRGYHIYCIETIRGGFDAFKSIVDANGGECNLFRGRVSYQTTREESDDESDEKQSSRKDIYLLSSAAPEHQKLWPRFRQLVHNMGKTPRIVRVDWLLDMAMSQELRVAEDYELSEGMIEQSEE